MLADDHGGMMMAGQQNVSTKLTKKRRGKVRILTPNEPNCGEMSIDFLANSGQFSTEKLACFEQIDDMIGTMRAADTETVRENPRLLFFSSWRRCF